MPLPSILVFSVNAHPFTTRQPDPKIAEIRLQKLKDAVGETKIPIGVTGKNLEGWGTAKVSYDIISDEIRGLVTQLSVIKDVTYKQLFHIQYEDGAKMLTVGGALFESKDLATFDNAGFGKLPFVRSGSEAYQIKVPTLTFKEMRYLDRLLPNGLTHVDPELLPPADVKAYAEIYRYFPTFAETDL
jgi:hypothetical protein